jgi:primase-polymerase (primpol)-like protein
MLGEGLACWDLDNVIDDGVLHSVAVDVLDEVIPLWVERSMSGAGLHVFVHGEGRSHQSEHVSYYSHARFIAVTGDQYWLPR